MTTNEKILLVQLLLEDIRGNWGWENVKGVICHRANKAKELCEEIAGEIANTDFLTLANACAIYIKYYHEDGDGRFFRDAFPHGYNNMENLHGLSSTINDKSAELKELALEFLTYPEFRFEDWDEYLRKCMLEDSKNI